MMDTLSQSTRIKYYLAEFRTLGDVKRNGVLDHGEFLRLMTLLGLPDTTRTAEVLWHRQKRICECSMTMNQYISLMMDPAVDAKTNMWRKLFAQFDTDGKGFASRQDMEKGLEKLGVEVGEEMKAKIQAMDSDNDDCIHYGDFLQMQLFHK